MKTLTEIRRSFIDFFVKNGHKHVASSPLVPQNDPTLMFTNSGMVQFKDVFTGKEERSYKRATSSQKSVRAGGKHNDLDNVGYTGRHLTFFEMLGNFSFGDYFKEEAINYAWECITKELSLPKDKLYITVFHEDEEAYNLWKKVTNFSDDKIIKIKTNDNFWSMGDTGPCGPCSEIFFDHGEHIWGGLPGTKDEDGDRFVEIWNLVFMQYEQLADGKRIVLPKKSIDTGMGLERISAVVQGVTDNYETDLFKELIGYIEDYTKVKAVGEEKFSHRVIADHLRSCAFLIADGVMPSNEGRGYVLRRIFRRAIRHASHLGSKDLLMPKLVKPLVNLMSDYSELSRGSDLITQVFTQEEQNFRRTLDKGLKLLETEVSSLNQGDKLSGEVAFKLHDTFGFPLDLTVDILRKREIDVDQDAFEVHMQNQKNMARKFWAGSGEEKIDDIWFNIYEKYGLTEFLGYQSLNVQGKVIALVEGDNLVEQVEGLGKKFYLVVNQTSFYAESGGQIGDIGFVYNKGLRAKVIDTKKPVKGLHVHICELEDGEIKIGDIINLEVNNEFRSAVKANHTATHLLHAILRKKLGNHVVQKGSLVSAQYLRFDFSNPSSIDPTIITDIESEINQIILSNAKVQIKLMSFDDATSNGAMALFGEKYDNEVRVVFIGENDEDYPSIELCGGTHVSRLGEIGQFRIISETAISAGVRRIEAITQMQSFRFNIGEQEIIKKLMLSLKSNKEALVERVESLIEQKKQLEKELKLVNLASLRSTLFDKTRITNIGKIKLLTVSAKDYDTKDLAQIAQEYCSQDQDLLVVVLNKNAQNFAYVCISGKVAAEYVPADELLKFIANKLGGKGGGNKLQAQGAATGDFNAAELIILIDNIVKDKMK